MAVKERTNESSRRGAARILIADDHDVIRAGLVAMLGKHRRFQICGESSDEKTLLELIKRLQPDLLILDLFLGHRDGLLLIKDIRQRFPSTRVLAICDHGENVYALRALGAGASGFLLKQAPHAQFISAVEAILSGTTYLSPECQLLTRHAPVARSPADRTLA